MDKKDSHKTIKPSPNDLHCGITTSFSAGALFHIKEINNNV